MSVVFENNHLYFLDHHEYACNLYRSVFVKNDAKNNEVNISYRLPANYFSIRGNKIIKNRKRTHDSTNDLHSETVDVQQMYNEQIGNIPEDLKSSIRNKLNLLQVTEVRSLAKKLFEATVLDHLNLSGGNNSEHFIKCTIKGQEFLLPQNCRFLCGDVKEQCEKLSGNKYDIVVADPPWWNKFIRRLKSANHKLSYSMMYNEDIASIPVHNLLSDDCIIAVWCTNAPSNIDAVKNQIFPKWGVEYITTWYWLKVTTDLEPLCNFGAGFKKQPYERLILGKVGNVKEVPEKKLIMSVPSALHSHKPPLLDILSKLVSAESPKSLELFARYLLPQTTSVGFEPLKWQHLSLYESDDS